MRVLPYQPEHFELWNNFIENSENGNFLFHRNFMKYHKDRFQDSSVMLFDDKDKLVAVFPANVRENVVYSHQGLTYGGLILTDRKHIEKIIAYFYSIVEFFKEQGIEKMIYKPVPNYIANKPCDAEHFIMKILDAQILRVDTSFVTHLNEEVILQERRKRSIKKAMQNKNIKIEIDNNFERYWKEVLEPNLWERYQTKPVHSLEEIQMLHHRFPDKILQANAYLSDKIVSGITLFIFNQTAHCQYISSIDEGRNSGALDWLFYKLIEYFQPTKRYFSMGTSNNDGNDLNLGVSEYKESFDVKIYAHFHYTFATSDINHLKKFIEYAKN